MDEKYTIAFIMRKRLYVGELFYIYLLKGERERETVLPTTKKNRNGV